MVNANNTQIIGLRVEKLVNKQLTFILLLIDKQKYEMLLYEDSSYKLTKVNTFQGTTHFPIDKSLARKVNLYNNCLYSVFNTYIDFDKFVQHKVRKIDDVPLLVLYGQSCCMKSYIGAVCANSSSNKIVFETDAINDLSDIDKDCPFDVLVIGNRHKWSIDRVMNELNTFNRNVIKINFSS